jgi:glycosyltransferase involved in cell wall biosynthesis
LTKILFLDHSSHAAGAAMSLRYLAAGLLADGHEVHVALLWPSPALETFYRDAGLTLHSVPGFPTIPHTTAGWVRAGSPRSVWSLLKAWCRYPASAARLRALVDQLKPDIVHLNSVTLLLAAVALRRHPAKVVWHIRESPPFEGRGWRTQAIAHLMRTAVDETIFISRHDQRLWINGQHGTVVYCCTPTPAGHHAESDTALRASLGIGQCGRVVLFVGGYQEIKGFDVLCHAFAQVCGQIPDVKLVILGANVPPPASRLAALARRFGPYFGVRPYFEQCRRLLDQCVPDDRRVVMPLVPNVGDYLQACEFLVFPSVRPHFARPVIEAALAGKPAIASNFDGIREVVVEGEGALLVPPGNVQELASSMADLLANPAKSEAMGQRARLAAGERFTVERHVQAIEAVYDRIVAKGVAP